MPQTLSLIVGLLFLIPSSLPSNQGTRTEAELVHRFERFSGDHGISEAVIDFAFHPHGSGDRTAIRVCSKDPFPLALFTAAADPFIIVDRVANKFLPDQVLFLRSEDCLGSDPAVAATELWAIPKGALLPSFVESIKASQVRLESIRAEDRPGAAGMRNYKAAVNDLTKKLRGKQQAVGVVLGYYYKNPSLVMKRRVREVRRILEQSGLSRDRYFVRLVPWTGEYGVDPPDPEPRYPSVLIVEMEKR